MAGTDSRFDAALFRQNIKFAMHMGLPDNEEERPTFLWRSIKSFSGSTDAGGKPLNWKQSSTAEDAPDPFQCDCAVEFSNGADVANPAAESLEDVKVTITILDVDWADVLANGDGRRPDQVQFVDSVYDIDFVAPPIGLFDATVYQLYCRSIDEN